MYLKHKSNLRERGSGEGQGCIFLAAKKSSILRQNVLSQFYCRTFYKAPHHSNSIRHDRTMTLIDSVYTSGITGARNIKTKSKISKGSWYERNWVPNWQFYHLATTIWNLIYHLAIFLFSIKNLSADYHKAKTRRGPITKHRYNS